MGGSTESPFWSAVHRACYRVQHGEPCVYVISVDGGFLALSAAIAEAIATAGDGTILVRVGR